MRLRKAELDAVSAVLAAEYGDESELVKTLFQCVLECLEERDGYGLAWGAAAVGPFYDKRQAEKIAKALDDKAYVAPLISVAAARRWAAAANPEHDGQHCSKCGHPKFSHSEIHVHTKDVNVDRIGCLARGCACPEVFHRKSWGTRSKLAKGAFTVQPSIGLIDPEDDEDD